MSKTKAGTTFRGDVLRLVSGTAVAQGLSIAASPILTRLFTPGDFGFVALFLSLSGILGVVPCLSYELAIVLPEDDGEAANVFGLALFSALLFGLLLIPVVWLLGPTLAGWVRMPSLAPFLWLLPASVLLQGGFLAFNYWNTRTKDFMRLSVARVGQAGADVGTRLAVGFAGSASGGAMVISSLLGQLVGTAGLAVQVLRDHGAYFARNIRWRAMKAQGSRYRDFPKYNVSAALLNSASFQAPVILLGAYFGPAVVGYYALGFRLLQTPMRLVGAAIAQVFIQRAARAKTEGTLGALTAGLLQKLALLGGLPLFTLGLMGETLFKVCFGPEWAEAGVYAQILSIWAFCQFLSSPLSQLITVLERQEFGLKLNAMLLATRVASMMIGGILGNGRVALALFSGTGILIYGYLILFVARESGLTSREMFLVARRIAVHVLPFMMIGALIVGLGGPPLWQLLLAGFVGVVYFYRTLALLKISNEQTAWQDW